MRCVVSCSSTSFLWLVFFFGALLWGSMIHKHTLIQEYGCEKGALTLLDLVWTYCTSLYVIKKLVAWRVSKDNAWLTKKFGSFSNWRNQHWKTNKTSSASRSLSSTDTTSFSFCNYFLPFFVIIIKLKLKSSKVHFILSAPCPFKI